MRQRLIELAAVCAACALAAGPSFAGAIPAAGPPARPGVTVQVAGGCGGATAVAIVKRLHLGNADFTDRPVAQTLCGAFIGAGSTALVVSLSIPSCGISGGWVVFKKLPGSRWLFVFESINGAFLAAAPGGGIRETQNVLRPGDAHCFPTGGTRSRIWRWNGSTFTIGAWKYSKPHKPSNPTGPVRPDIRRFAVAVENQLRGLAAGRTNLVAALVGAADCSLPYATAAGRVAGVIGNRTSILGKLNRTAAADVQTQDAKTALLSALQHAIAADQHYRAWLDGLGRTGAGCPPPHNAEFAAAGREDTQATAAKRTFLASFNPLARDLGLRTWDVSEF